VSTPSSRINNNNKKLTPSRETHLRRSLLKYFHHVVCKLLRPAYEVPLHELCLFGATKMTLQRLLRMDYHTMMESRFLTGRGHRRSSKKRKFSGISAPVVYVLSLSLSLSLSQSFDFENIIIYQTQTPHKSTRYSLPDVTRVAWIAAAFFASSGSHLVCLHDLHASFNNLARRADKRAEEIERGKNSKRRKKKLDESDLHAQKFKIDNEAPETALGTSLVNTTLCKTFPIKEYPGYAKFRGVITNFVRSDDGLGGFYEVEYEDGDIQKMSLEEVKECTHHVGKTLIGRNVKKDFGPQRGFVKKYRKKKNEFVIEYFESNWKEVVKEKSQVVNMLVPFRSAEDIELPLNYSGGVVVRYIKKNATFRVEINGDKRDISLKWLKQCVRRDLSKDKEEEFDCRYLENRHVLRQDGACKGTVKKYFEKTKTYLVKFENGVEERLLLNSLLPMMLNSSSETIDSDTFASKKKDEDRFLNARFVQALQMLERCGFLRTATRRTNHVTRVHTSMYLDSVQWVKEG